MKAFTSCCPEAQISLWPLARSGKPSITSTDPGPITPTPRNKCRILQRRAGTTTTMPAVWGWWRRSRCATSHWSTKSSIRPSNPTLRLSWFRPWETRCSHNWTSGATWAVSRSWTSPPSDASFAGGQRTRLWNWTTLCGEPKKWGWRRSSLPGHQSTAVRRLGMRVYPTPLGQQSPSLRVSHIHGFCPWSGKTREGILTV